MPTTIRRPLAASVLTAVVLALVGVPAMAATSTPGGKCSKVNVTAKIGGTKYTCTKVGGALKWVDPKCDAAKLTTLQNRQNEAKLLFPNEAQYKEDLAKAQDWVKEEIEEGEEDETMKARLEVARIESMYKSGLKKAKAALAASTAAIAGCRATFG